MSVAGPGAVRSLAETRLALTEVLARLDGEAAEIELLVQQTRTELATPASWTKRGAPIRMLLLVGCIFPSMFIVILGPALIMIMVNLGEGGI